MGTKSLPISRCCLAILTRCERRNSIPMRRGQPASTMARRICITERAVLTIKKERRTDLLRLPITTDRINAANAILASRRLVLLRRPQPLSKTASNTTLTSSKTPWRTTSTVAITNSSSCARPRTRPIVRVTRLIRPSKRFRASVRVSPRPAATAWLPSRSRAM